MAWDKPIPEPCPQCGAKFLVKKETRAGTTVKCLSCDFKKSEGEQAA